MNILDYIPTGRENAISRQELAQLTGKGDRQIRMEIKQLVHKGHPILSSSHAKGYWLSDDPAEIEQFLKECDSRRRTEYRTTEPLRKYLAQLQGKRTVTVSQHIRRIGSEKLEGQLTMNGVI